MILININVIYYIFMMYLLLSIYLSVCIAIFFILTALQYITKKLTFKNTKSIQINYNNHTIIPRMLHYVLHL